MARLYNLARAATSTTGTGTITLGSAVTGFLSFSAAAVQNGDVVTYAIEDGTNREIGRGTYTASGTMLSRDTVLASTNGGAKISLSGNAQVFITAAAEDFRSLYLDDGSQAAPSMTFSADQDTGLWRIGANNLAVGAGGTKAIDLSATQVHVPLTTTSTSTTTGALRVSGGVGIGGDTYVGGDLIMPGGSNTAVVCLNNASTPAAPASGGKLYGAGGELRGIDAAGNVTVLTPHRFDLIPGGPSEPMAWAYWSQRREPDGIHTVNADITRALRLLEGLTGEKLVHLARDAVAIETTPYGNRIAALEARIAALEHQRPRRRRKAE